jgi:hypothetical protein
MKIIELPPIQTNGLLHFPHRPLPLETGRKRTAADPFI